MKKFIHRHAEHIPRLLYCLAAVVVVFLGSRVLAFRDGLDIPADAAGMVDAGKLNVSDLVKPFKESAEKLKKQDIFMPPPPKNKLEPPICQGIVGSTVLIGDKFYKRGDNVQGAEILEVGPATVLVKWHDKEIQLAPFLAQDQPGKDGQQHSGPPKQTDGPSPAQPSDQPEQQQEPDGRQRPEPGMRPGAGGESLRGQWRQMSSEQREQMRQRWEQMSPEERREMRDRMRGGRGIRPN